MAGIALLNRLWSERNRYTVNMPEGFGNRHGVTIASTLSCVALLTVTASCSRSTTPLAAVGSTGAAVAMPEAASRPAPVPGKLITGADTFGDWTTDAPGVRRKITVNDLPPPFSSNSANNGPHVVAQPNGAWPKVMTGFTIERWATGLRNPRKLVTSPNGDIFVSESEGHSVEVLRDSKGTGKPDVHEVFATDLPLPFGIAFYPAGPNPKWVYVACTDRVVRFPYQNGDLHARGPAETIVDDIPGYGRLRGGGHWTRDLVFSADERRMYVSVGSRTNVDERDEESERKRALIYTFTPEGKDPGIYAYGIRNPVGLAIQPGSGTLWTSVNERDGLGDNLPPDYITHVEKGGFYGWPWYYIGPHPDPRKEGMHPELRDKVIVPDVLLEAHYASLNLTFYTAKKFPTEFQNGIFACEHGSWNRARRTGYSVIFVPIKDGKATGEFDDFVTGFVADDGAVWGRPVGITVAQDGALLFSDDGTNSIWRVTYTGKPGAK